MSDSEHKPIQVHPEAKHPVASMTIQGIVVALVASIWHSVDQYQSGDITGLVLGLHIALEVGAAWGAYGLRAATVQLKSPLKTLLGGIVITSLLVGCVRTGEFKGTDLTWGIHIPAPSLGILYVDGEEKCRGTGEKALRIYAEAGKVYAATGDCKVGVKPGPDGKDVEVKKCVLTEVK